MTKSIMPQPSGSYLLIGSGRLATHLSHYFSLLGLSFNSWSRKDPIDRLDQLLSENPLVMLAISDQALDLFFEHYLNGKNLRVVHFSGAFHSDKMVACHPLMTFGKSLYELSTYKKIHFGVTNVASLQEILEFLPNPSFIIAAKDKALYHALCVLSAAGAQRIWDQSEKILAEIGVPSKALGPYIKQIADNYIESGAKALTGPWVRRDQKTISENIQALTKKSAPLKEVYESLKEGL